jgi:hypothetical protein
MARRLGFNNFSGGYTARTDFYFLDRPFEIDFNLLEVGEEAAQAFTDNLRTGPTRPFDLSASFIFHPGDSPFVAYGAYFRHDS